MVNFRCQLDWIERCLKNWYIITSRYVEGGIFQRKQQTEKTHSDYRCPPSNCLKPNGWVSPSPPPPLPPLSIVGVFSVVAAIDISLWTLRFSPVDLRVLRPLALDWGCLLILKLPVS
jgi:hypothetical protein